MKIKIKLKLAVKLSYSLCELTLPFIERSGRARSNRKSIDSSEKFSDRDARIRRGGGGRRRRSLDTFNLRQCRAFVRPPYSPFRLVLLSGEGNPFAITSHLLFRPFRLILVPFGKRRAIRIPRGGPLPPRACNFGKSLIPSIPFYFFFHPTRATHQNGIPFLSVTTNAARFVNREKYKPVKVGEFYPSGSSSFTAY